MQEELRQFSFKLLSTNSHQLLSLFSWPGATLINSHRCLTRSKESQNNFHTNSCLPTLISFHQEQEESKQLSHTNETNEFDKFKTRSKYIIYLRTVKISQTISEERENRFIFFLFKKKNILQTLIYSLFQTAGVILYVQSVQSL